MTDIKTPTPNDVHRLFAEYFVAGDLDALLSLYEPNAALLPRPASAVALGTAEVREALANFLALEGDFRMQPVNAIETGDIALLISDWELSTVAYDGSPIQTSGRTADVVRRQADGRWLFVIDSPYGTSVLS